MLAAVMVVCMIPISAANAVMISIGSAELVVGETIELPVTVSSDVAIGSFDAQVVYDSSYLSLTKVKTGDLNGIIMGGNQVLRRLRVSDHHVPAAEAPLFDGWRITELL